MHRVLAAKQCIGRFTNSKTNSHNCQIKMTTKYCSVTMVLYCMYLFVRVHGSVGEEGVFLDLRDRLVSVGTAAAQSELWVSVDQLWVVGSGEWVVVGGSG